MSDDDVTTLRTPRRRRDAVLLSVGVLVAIVAAMLPVFSVIEPGSWTVSAAGVVVAVLAAGTAARLFSLPALAASMLELAVWLVLLSALFGRGTPLFGVIPTPATFGLVPDLLAGAAEEVRLGVAPVVPAAGLAFVLVAAVGALAIVLDHVVLTARMPLLAGVGLVAVSLIPTIAVPADVDVPGFVLLAAAILFLLRIETRSRSRLPRPAEPARRLRFAGASATAVGLAAVAVVVAVVATPLLPQPALRFASGGTGGFGTTINPNLELGNDLRQPREVDVLSVRTTAPTAPYLRAVTLSRFDGAVWEPDTGDTVPVREDAPVFDPVAVDDDIALGDWTTDIVVDELDSPWLPVPYPAGQVSGLEGDWLGIPANRTVVSRASSSRDQEYEVTAHVPRPTLEQIRARPTSAEGLGDDVLSLPAEVPAIIGDTAREVTDGAASPYDALIDLQSWFRGSQFRYSLDAPVEEGFDGAGLDAVAQFLERREGYCVHYASAFAVMARTLGMPARIVVGYLPGTPTSSAQQDQTTYIVSSQQLHAWPEVHFQGIGWVPFEPTNSLGVPTNFAPGTTGGASAPVDTPQQPEAAAPTAQPSSPADRPGADDLLSDGSTGGSSTDADDTRWWQVAVPAAVIALLLVAPAALRELRRRRRRTAILAGDAVEAWTAVREEALDLGIPAPASDSPRRYADRLVDRHHAAAEPLSLLVAAIEGTSYAEEPSRVAGAGLSAAVDAVRSSLRTGASLPRRALARVLPRSLVVRPGSAYAEVREPVSR